MTGTVFCCCFFVFFCCALEITDKSKQTAPQCKRRDKGNCRLEKTDLHNLISLLANNWQPQKTPALHTRPRPTDVTILVAVDVLLTPTISCCAVAPPTADVPWVFVDRGSVTHESCKISPPLRRISFSALMRPSHGGKGPVFENNHFPPASPSCGYLPNRNAFGFSSHLPFHIISSPPSSPPWACCFVTRWL